MQALPTHTMFSQYSFYLVSSAFFVSLAVAVAYLLAPFSRNKAHSELWSSLDVVGLRRRGFLPWPRAVFGSIIKTAQNAADGYQQFCKAHNRPFALPTIWTGSAVVVLPPSLLHLLNRPDNELAAHRAQNETIQLPYMIADSDVYNNPIHFEVIRKTLAPKQVGNFAAPAAEELDRAFRACWQDSGSCPDGRSDWVTLNNWDACGKVISRAALRVLVGDILCQDQRILGATARYADAVVMGTATINCLPPSLRPWIAPLLALPAKYNQSRCLKLLVPVIEERIRVWESSKSGVAHDMPDDFLQWMIERCAKSGPEQMKPRRIALRLLALVNMSVMGMVWVLSHCIQDLYRSPSKDEFLAGLQEEIMRMTEHSEFSKTTNVLGSKDTIDRLDRLDSTLRESMRLSAISIVSVARDVVSEELDLGLGDGMKLPRGVRVVFPSQPMHRDPDFTFHERPLEFDAFRFSRPFEAHKTRGSGSEEATLERAAASSTVPSQSFLAWGYGKHACTARWYAAQTLKQALAYIILNYDVEVLGDSRKSMSLVNVMVPHLDVQIRIRRKRS